MTDVRRTLKLLIPMLALAFAFGYMNVYANLTTTAYSRTRLMTMYKQEKIKNERLKLMLTSRSGPQEVTSAAAKAGMVYATKYDYLGKPQNVASAER